MAVRRNRFFAIPAVIAVGLTLPIAGAVAGDAPAAQAGAATAARLGPITLYRQYDEALQREDFAAAAPLGVQAWEAARDSWPDSNPNKAAMAYNAAWILTMTGRAAEAVEPASAALRLAPDGHDAFDRRYAIFLDAMAKLETAGDRNRAPALRALLGAAEAVPVDADLDFVMPVGLYRAAKLAISSRNAMIARRLANRAIEGFEATGMTGGPLLSDAYMTRSISYAITNWSPAEIERAANDAARARELLGPAVHPVSQERYTIIAWEAALHGLRRSQDPDYRIPDRSDGSLSAQLGRDAPCPPIQRAPGGGSIVFPQAQHMDERVGGAVILMDLAVDGTVESARVAASIPNADFGEAAVDTMRRWRYVLPEGLAEHCRKDQPVTVTYAFH